MFKLSLNLFSLALLAALAAALGLAYFHPESLWRAQALGRVLAEQNAFPSRDPFLFSLPGAAFDRSGWLASLGYFALGQASGGRGLAVLHSALSLAAFGLLLATAYRRGSRPFGAAAFALAGLAAFLSSGASPLNAAFFAGAIYIMEGEFWASFQSRWIWLPLLAALWANLDRAALLLPCLALLWAWGQPSRDWAPRLPGLAVGALLAALWVCLALRPDGPWPPLERADLSLRPAWPWLSESIWPSLALSLGGLVLWLASRWLPAQGPWARDGRLLLPLLLGGLLWRELLPFAALYGAPLAASRLRLMADSLGSAGLALGWMLKLGLLGMALWVSPRILARAAATPQAPSLPRETLDFLRDEVLDAQLMHEPDWGAYLLQAMPGLRVFDDGSRRLRGPVKAEYLAALRAEPAGMGAEPAWRRVLDSHGVDAALLRLNSPLAKALSLAQEWQPVAYDRVAVLYLRATALHQPLIKTWAPRGLRPGDLDEPVVLSRLPQAGADLEAARLRLPKLGMLYFYQSRLALKAGKAETAKAWLEQGIRVEPGLGLLYVELARQRHAQGDRAAAGAFAARARSLGLEPYWPALP